MYMLALVDTHTHTEQLGPATYFIKFMNEEAKTPE